MSVAQRAVVTLRVVAGSWLVQFRSMRGNPDWYLALIVAPVHTAVFVTIFQHAGRGDLTAYGVLAPALITLWAMSLQTSGELISRERENGSLEGLLAAPGRLDAMLLGRTAAVTVISLLAFVESWTIGWLLTGEIVRIEHPGIFVATVLATATAMTGWAGVMASVFVLARSARTFQNSLSYPFYVLGGVIVPVSLLPVWLHPFSAMVFLSWSSDLLRDSLAAEPVTTPAVRVLIILALGAVGFGLARILLHRALLRVRKTGSLSYA